VLFAALFCCGLLSGCGSSVDKKPAVDKKAERTRTAGNSGPPPEPAARVPYSPRPPGTLSFSADIAPIVFQKCAACHRPGEIGPFSLLSYADVKKRARQIVAVTERRVMPPWSAAPGYCQFQNDRSLTVEELGKIAQWADEGAPEGSPADLPRLPEFVDGWKYGPPDLVVQMPEPYTLAADASDANRFFTIRVPIPEMKYVKGWDFHPGNTKIVHHAFLTVDNSGWSRHLDDMDPLPGYDGTRLEGGASPPGFNLGWLPGSPPPPPDQSLSWRLEPGTDLVLELHLVGTGKEETVRSSIALYFAPRPPTAHPGIAALIAREIDIPPGEKTYVVHDEYVLPVAATVTGIAPHAHFRGKDMQVWAELPDGSKSWLLRIKDWDFNWQTRYSYTKPFNFPQETRLCMQIIYDNSAENPRNPTIPPERVLLGRRSRDEMGEIVVSLLMDSERDQALLQRAFELKTAAKRIEQLEFLARCDPNDAETQFMLGVKFQGLGDIQRAIDHYERAIRIDSNHSRSRNNLGSCYRKAGRISDAMVQYTEAIRIYPDDARAHNNLGSIHLAQGDLDLAASQFDAALRINPDFQEAEYNLGALALHRKDLAAARVHFERVLTLNPHYEPARAALERLRSESP
jgi:Tfp pilus assembly protein PilF